MDEMDKMDTLGGSDEPGGGLWGIRGMSGTNEMNGTGGGADEFLPWGRLRGLEPARVHAPAFRTDAAFSGRRNLFAGALRSYGDSCCVRGGDLISMRRLDRILAFDPESGTIRCEAGATLRSILDFCRPRGWTLPVVPGTAQATVGGAVANDVHGKNHHRKGSFGAHLLSLSLLRSDEGAVACGAGVREDLFRACIGGLGLPGAILDVEIALERCAGAVVEVETERFGSLEECLAMDAEAEGRFEHVVSWIDVLAGGSRMGRGHLMRADPVAGGIADKSRFSPFLPLTPPVSLVSSWTARAFNALYQAKSPKRAERRRMDADAFHHPLDGIGGWNRAYGPKGFRQYQCVVPKEAALEVYSGFLRATSSCGAGSPLVVLKSFGEGGCGDSAGRRFTGPPTLSLPSSLPSSSGPLSFPMRGTTLAMDFPAGAPNLSALLDRFDAAVLEAGGRVYPAKDSRMSMRSFEAFFPGGGEMEKFRDPKVTSSFWERVRPA